jgi:hypothetical protein
MEIWVQLLGQIGLRSREEFLQKKAEEIRKKTQGRNIDVIKTLECLPIAKWYQQMVYYTRWKIA